MSPYRQNLITRLNLLLAFAQRLDLNQLSNGQWEKLRKDLVYIVYDRKKVTAADRNFMKIGSILEARGPLLDAVNDLHSGGAADLHLGQQDVIISAPEGKPFSYSYLPADLTTALWGSLAYLLDKAEIGREDLLECANPTCQLPYVKESANPMHSGRIFIPARRPSKVVYLESGETRIPQSKRAFCSQRCARIVAVRDYRARLRGDAQKHETVKEKERKRGKQRYRKKVLKK